MLRTLLICADEQARREIPKALERVPDLQVVGVLNAHPSPDDLLRMIRVRRANLVLLDVDDFDRARVLAQCVDNTMPGLPIITFGKKDGMELLPRLMHIGVRDHLSLPVDAAAVANSAEAARTRLQTHPPAALRLGDVYAFLPAKPGVGTSTIAMSTSCAVAEEVGARTLLLDCDLAAGTIQFLLKLGQSASLVDAVNHAANLDEDLWSQMVGHWGKLEVLHAGRLDPPPEMDLEGLDRVLAAARAQYEVICADLPSSMDPFSIALMKEARRIFLVTTPEVVPLYMASARLKRLKELGLDEKVSLLLNRKVASKFGDDEVAAAVGMPVTYRFSNDYRGVQSSILEAAPVGHESSLGQSILNLAQSLAPQVEVKAAAHGPKRKFLEFFHTHHANDADLVLRG